MQSVPLDSANIAAQDVVLIVTDHSQVDYQTVLDSARLIFDSRNVFEEEHEKVVKL